jgi:Transposase DDE domain
LVSLDGSTLDVADEASNEEAFRPAWSQPREQRLSANPLCFPGREQHARVFGSQMADYGTGEITLANTVLASLQPGMLCLADRQFFGLAVESGAPDRADLL